MPDRADRQSLRDFTSAIRHLDAARARVLVSLFHRPIPATGQPPAYDARDPVNDATGGHLSLARSPADADAGLLGHYATHLYLPARGDPAPALRGP